MSEGLSLSGGEADMTGGLMESIVNPLLGEATGLNEMVAKTFKEAPERARRLALSILKETTQTRQAARDNLEQLMARMTVFQKIRFLVQEAFGGVLDDLDLGLANEDEDSRETVEASMLVGNYTGTFSKIAEGQWLAPSGTPITEMLLKNLTSPRKNRRLPFHLFPSRVVYTPLDLSQQTFAFPLLKKAAEGQGFTLTELKLGDPVQRPGHKEIQMIFPSDDGTDVLPVAGAKVDLDTVDWWVEVYKQGGAKLVNQWLGCTTLLVAIAVRIGTPLDEVLARYQITLAEDDPIRKQLSTLAPVPGTSVPAETASVTPDADTPSTATTAASVTPAAETSAPEDPPRP